MLRTTPPPKWMWIGNSNTRPYITHFDTEFRKFVLCTKIDQFKNEIDRAPDNCDYLTISGLDTIIADLGGQSEVNPEALEAQLDKTFSVLETFRMQGMKIVVEPLLLWKKHSESLRRAAIAAVKSIKIKFPGILFPPKPDSLKFLPDGVHLTDRAGSKLFTAMYDASIKFFNEKDDSYETGEDTATNSDSSMASDKELEIVSNNLKRKDIPPTMPPNYGKKLKFTPTRTRNENPGSSIKPILVHLENDDEDSSNKHSFGSRDFASFKELNLLKRKVEQRWSIDLFVSAGTKEDLDKIENEKNMNKIIFSGIEINDFWAANLTWADRIDKIKANISDLIKMIDPSGTYHLGYVRHLNFKLKGARQIFEITMADEKEAKALRKAYGTKVKEWRESSFPDEVKGVSLGPALTLATRVRIAILQAIAKEIKECCEDTDSWVIQHVARPVLKVEVALNDGSKSISSFGFAQAVAYLNQNLPNSHLRTQQLFDAYSIAGNRFGQEIAHYFIILDHSTASTIAINRKPRKKRPIRQETNQNKNKKD